MQMFRSFSAYLYALVGISSLVFALLFFSYDLIQTYYLVVTPWALWSIVLVFFLIAVYCLALVLEKLLAQKAVIKKQFWLRFSLLMLTSLIALVGFFLPLPTKSVVIVLALAGGLLFFWLGSDPWKKHGLALFLPSLVCWALVLFFGLTFFPYEVLSPLPEPAFIAFQALVEALFIGLFLIFCLYWIEHRKLPDAYFRVIYGSDFGKVYPVWKDTVSLGSSNNDDFCFSNYVGVRPGHIQIVKYRTPRAYFLRSNYLIGELVSVNYRYFQDEQILEDGDLIVCGNLRLQFFILR